MLIDNQNNIRMLRGILIMIAGVTLLLHTLGLIQAGLSFFLIVVAVSAIIYGFYISGLYTMLSGYWSKHTPEQPPKHE